MLKDNVETTLFSHTLKSPVQLLSTIMFILSLSIFFKKTGLFSSLLGILFSFFLFLNLYKSQQAILNKNAHKLAFTSFFLRLCLYAFPLSLALLYKNYLNIWLVLLSLVWFQLGFILKETIMALKQLKAKQTNNN